MPRVVFKQATGGLEITTICMIGGPCGTCGAEENTYRIVVGKAEGNRPLGRTRRGWEHTIKIDLKGIGLEGRGWAWNGYIWPKIRVCGGQLLTR